MKLGRFGVWTSCRAIGEEHLAEAAELAEQLGYGTFWLGGSPRLPQVRPVLQATAGLVAATSIVNVWAYDPAQLAAEFWELENEFPGRLLVGVGIGHPEASGDYSKPFSAMRSFLDGLEEIKRKVAEEGGLSPVYYPPLSQLDPALLDYCTKAIERSRQFAIKWLKQHMCKGDASQAETIAARLLDVSRYLSHGIVIDAAEAREMGLTVEFLPPEDNLWRALWMLHCIYQVDVKSTGGGVKKFFESAHVSIRL